MHTQKSVNITKQQCITNNHFVVDIVQFVHWQIKRYVAMHHTRLNFLSFALSSFSLPLLATCLFGNSHSCCSLLLPFVFVHHYTNRRTQIMEITYCSCLLCCSCSCVCDLFLLDNVTV